MQRWIKMGILLASLSVSGCYAQSKCEVLLEPQQAEQVAKQFLSAMAQNDLAAAQPWISYPFYADGEPLTPAQLAADWPDDAPNDRATPDFDLEMRLYPPEDLAVLWPEIWQTLKLHLPQEKGLLYLAPIVIQTEKKPEKGWLLLRQTENGWRVAGLLDG